jgi:RNA polymerase sigma-70 factor (ECF subfamily)
MTRRGSRPEVDVSDTAFWMATFQEHGSAVIAFLTSRTGRRDVAEDLLQETFVRAMRARPTLPDAGGIRSYLLTTAHRLLISRHRKKRPFLFSEMAEREAAPFEELADEAAISPESAVSFVQFEERLRVVLEGLPPAHRAAFEDAVLQQKAYAEIASDRGWTPAQVKSNVHRARKQVIAALGDLLGPRSEQTS